MANPEEGQVEFESGGKKYVLEITTRTERLIQKRFGKPMGKIIPELAGGDVEIMIGLLHEALKKHHTDIKEDDVVDLLRPVELRETISRLLQATYPSDDEDPQEPGQGDATGPANSGSGSS